MSLTTKVSARDEQERATLYTRLGTLPLSLSVSRPAHAAAAALAILTVLSAGLRLTAGQSKLVRVPYRTSSLQLVPLAEFAPRRCSQHTLLPSSAACLNSHVP